MDSEHSIAFICLSFLLDLPNVHLHFRRGTSRKVRGVVGSGFQFPDDMPGKMILDFPVSRYGLTGTRSGILIPIIPPAMADEINPFHAN